MSTNINDQMGIPPPMTPQTYGTPGTFARGSPHVAPKATTGRSGIEYDSLWQRNSAPNAVRDGPFADPSRTSGGMAAQGIPMNAMLGGEMDGYDGNAALQNAWTPDHNQRAAEGSDQDTINRMNVRDPKHTITREYYVSVTSSPVAAANDVRTVTWKPDPNNPHVFQTKPKGKNAFNRENVRKGDISKAVVTRASITQVHSTSALPLAVKISGMSGNKYSGHVRSPFVIAGPMSQVLEGPEGTGIEIHRLSEELLNLANNRYSHLDVDELHKGIEPVIKMGPNSVAHRTHSSVPIDHPVVEILRKPENMELLGLTDALFDDSFSCRKGHIDLRNDIIDMGIQVITNKIIMRVPFTDLNKFEVSFETADGKRFDDPEALNAITTNGSAVSALLEKPFTVRLMLRMEYHLLDPKVHSSAKTNKKDKEAMADRANLKNLPMILKSD